MSMLGASRSTFFSASVEGMSHLNSYNLADSHRFVEATL